MNSERYRIFISHIQITDVYVMTISCEIIFKSIHKLYTHTKTLIIGLSVVLRVEVFVMNTNDINFTSYTSRVIYSSLASYSVC